MVLLVVKDTLILHDGVLRQSANVNHLLLRLLDLTRALLCIKVSSSCVIKLRVPYAVSLVVVASVIDLIKHHGHQVVVASWRRLGHVVAFLLAESFLT